MIIARPGMNAPRDQVLRCFRALDSALVCWSAAGKETFWSEASKDDNSDHYQGKEK